MSRALLSGDRCYQPRTLGYVSLDDDCGRSAPCGCGCDGTDPDVPPVDPGMMFTLRLRQRDGLDDKGNPRFLWRPVMQGPAFLTQERTEYDAEAGVTVATAEVAIPNTVGLVDVPETASVVSGTGIVWKVTGSVVDAVRVALKLRRIWHEAPPMDVA